MKARRTIVAFLFCATGCVLLPIPTPHGKILEGREVKPSALAFLQPSVTTKDEVIQRLGTPTIFWRDENTLVYRWVQREGILLWAVGGGYTGGLGALDITGNYAFIVKFDAVDRLVRSEVLPQQGRKSFGECLLDWRDAQRTNNAVKKEFQR